MASTCEIFRPRSRSTPQIRRPQVVQLVCSILSQNLRGIQIYPYANVPFRTPSALTSVCLLVTLARFPSSYCDAIYGL
jgi:hypothetical protein